MKAFLHLNLSTKSILFRVTFRKVMQGLTGFDNFAESSHF